LREGALKLEEQKTTLEGMIQSRDELIMEMAEEYGLNRLGEDDEDEDDDDKENATAPPYTCASYCCTCAPMDVVPEQEVPVAHEVIRADAEPEPQQPCLFNMIMRDYEESSPRMDHGPHELDDLDDLDDLTKADYDVDEWFPEDVSSD
jgi:hypothetical protein